jgi:cytochrome P450
MYIPLSKGTRACLGIHLAMMELKLTTAALVRACGDSRIEHEGRRYGHEGSFSGAARGWEMRADLHALREKVADKESR